PPMQFVAVEVVVAVVGERGRRAVFELEQRGHRAFGRPPCVPRAGDRADAAQRAAVERASNLDLVRDLVVHQYAAASWCGVATYKVQASPLAHSASAFSNAATPKSAAKRARASAFGSAPAAI